MNVATTPPARNVDDDVAHRLCGIAKEMRTISDLQLRAVDQPQEAFVHQRRGIEVRDPAVRSQARARQSTQLRVEDGKHLVERIALALRGEQQQLRQRRIGRLHFDSMVNSMREVCRRLAPAP